MILVEKKTGIVVVIIIAIVVVGALYFFILREQFDPFSNLEYVNRDDNFGLNPLEGWIVKEHNDGSSVISISIYYPPNNLSSFIQIDITPPPPGSNIKLDEQVDNFMQNYFPQFDPENFSSFTHNNRTVNGMDAYEFKFIVNYSCECFFAKFIENTFPH